MVKLFLSLFFCFVSTAQADDNYRQLAEPNHMLCSGSLEKCVAAAGVGTTITISEVLPPLTANVVVVPGVELSFKGLGLIACGSRTLTIQSSTANWPSRQIFASDCGNGEITGLTVANVKWWGSAGDGTSDDSSRIQTAGSSLTSGGFLFFPAGTYILASRLTFAIDALRLRGEGRQSSVLKLVDSANSANFGSCAASAGSPCSVVQLSGNDLLIDNLGFDGNGANQNAGANIFSMLVVTGNGSTSGLRNKIDNVFVKNASGHGIFCYQCAYSEIVNSRVENTPYATTNSGFAAISALRSIHVRILANSILDGTVHGIFLGSSGSETCWTAASCDVTISNNEVIGPDNICIAAGSNNSRITVIGNVARNCDANEIDTGDTRTVSIVGNTTSGGRTCIDIDGGTRTDGGENATISGNSCDSPATGNCITVASSSHYIDGVSITGNVCRNAYAYGIQVGAVRGGVIAGNTVMNANQGAASGPGILIGSSGGLGTQHTVITGNRSWNESGTSQTYGLEFNGSDTIINTAVGNDFTGNATGTILRTASADNFVIDLATTNDVRVKLGASGSDMMRWGQGFLQATGSLRLGAVSFTDTLWERDGVGIVQQGTDVAIPAAQTYKSCDGLGTDKAGCDFKLAGGGGTGTGIGGDIILCTSPPGSTGAALNACIDRGRIPNDGGFRYATGARPTCNAAHRGTTFYVAGGAGVVDTYEICRKDAADAYAWVTLY